MLVQQKAARNKTGAELETLGKYAAALYHRGQCSTLTEAVVSTVKTAGLSPEQVRRVVEFTNHAAYQTEFSKVGASHKFVEFVGGPADPAAILQDLNDGGGGSVFDTGSGDYQAPPPDFAKAAAANEARMGLDEVKLAELFQATPSPMPFAEPLAPALEARSKLASLYEEALAEMSLGETQLQMLGGELLERTKQAALAGVPLSHIVAAWGAGAGAQPEFIKAAFTMLTPALVTSGVFPSREELVESLAVKVAATPVNAAHPLVRTFSTWCETLNKLAATRQVMEDVETALGQVETFLKEASSASEIGGILGKIPKAVRGVTQATAKASRPVNAFTREMVEAAGGSVQAAERAGNVLGGAVKYAPHIAGGIALEDAYQRAKYNPMVQGAKNFVLSRVPYTHQNMIRQYSYQQGFPV